MIDATKEMKAVCAVVFCCLFCVLVAQDDLESSQLKSVPAPWPAAVNGNVRDLHREYSNIFKFGNRNAASHKWSSFILERSNQFTLEKLKEMFSGFCAVSGSPVQPSDYNRYRLSLPLVKGSERNITTGYMHYCCWCVIFSCCGFVRIN